MSGPCGPAWNHKSAEQMSQARAAVVALLAERGFSIMEMGDLGVVLAGKAIRHLVKESPERARSLVATIGEVFVNLLAERREGDA